MFTLYAIFLAFLSGFLGGWLAVFVFRWDLRRVSLGLEYRLTDLEGRVNREVKLRAAEASHKSRTSDRDLLEQIEAAKKTPAAPSLQEWTASRFKTQ